MPRLEKEKVLERIYYHMDGGFGSARDFYEKAREVDVGITETGWGPNRTSKHETTRIEILTLLRFPSMNSKLTWWMSPVCCET